MFEFIFAQKNLFLNGKNDIKECFHVLFRLLMQKERMIKTRVKRQRKEK